MSHQFKTTCCVTTFLLFTACGDGFFGSNSITDNELSGGFITGPANVYIDGARYITGSVTISSDEVILIPRTCVMGIKG